MKEKDWNENKNLRADWMKLGPTRQNRKQGSLPNYALVLTPPACAQHSCPHPCHLPGKHLWLGKVPGCKSLDADWVSRASSLALLFPCTSLSVWFWCFPHPTSCALNAARASWQPPKSEREGAWQWPQEANPAPWGRLPVRMRWTQWCHEDVGSSGDVSSSPSKNLSISPAK